MIRRFKDNFGNEIQIHGDLREATVWCFKDGVCQECLFTSFNVFGNLEELSEIESVYLGEGYIKEKDKNVEKLVKDAVKQLREKRLGVA